MVHVNFSFFLWWIWSQVIIPISKDINTKINFTLYITKCGELKLRLLKKIFRQMNCMILIAITKLDSFFSWGLGVRYMESNLWVFFTNSPRWFPIFFSNSLMNWKKGKERSDLNYSFHLVNTGTNEYQYDIFLHVHHKRYKRAEIGLVA